MVEASANYVCLVGSKEVVVDNSTPYISFGTETVIIEKNDFSLAFWFKTNENYCHLFDLCGNRIQGSHGNFICIRMTGAHDSGNGCIYGELDEDYNGKNYISVGDNSFKGYNDGQYHHVLFTRNENCVSFYIDGIKTKTVYSQQITNVTGESDFRIGKSYSGFTTPTIYFKDFRYYSYAVDEEELKEIIKTNDLS